MLPKFLALAIGAAVWLPCLHFFYKPDYAEYRADEGVAPRARMLTARHLEIWTNPELRRRELRKMQARNPEWDFMSRTFFAMALANMALRDPACKQQACEIIDAILENTMKLERERGIGHFLLGYARSSGRG